MKPFDERRIDPSTDELVNLLQRAMRRANARLTKRRIDKKQQFWLDFVRRQRSKPHGVMQYQGGRGGIPAARMRIAWWSDPIGRRHWRVIGEQLDYTHRDTLPPEFAGFPLTQVYPEGVMLCRDDHGERLVVACRCGAVGTPASLGWVGSCCGPCHDRREEGEVPLAHAGATRVFPGERDVVIMQVAFVARDQLLARSNHGRVYLLDLRDGSRRELSNPAAGQIQCLTASMRGVVALATPHSVLVGHVHEEPIRWQIIEQSMLHMDRMLLAPDDRRLVVLGYEQTFLFDLITETVRMLPLPERQWISGGMAFLPDKPNHLLVHDFEQGMLDLDLHTEQLTVISGNPAMDRDSLWSLLLSIDLVNQERRPMVSPDGRFVAVDAVLGGVSAIHLLDTRTQEWKMIAPQDPSGDRGTRLLCWTRAGQLAVRSQGWMELWDVGTLKQLGSVLPLEPTLSAWWVCHISEDGEKFVEADIQGTVRVWPWLQALCGN